jgi:N-acetylmuramoyl-L-alanine amidase
LIQKALPDTPKPAEPTSYGKRTLTRMLGLKIGKIVLDPGHGGHDLGTIGPGGLVEKDLVLELAFRLKKMLEQKLDAEVILTRDKDIFVSLEERTEIANSSHADLFISIHANSSRYRSTSGVETYYLDFAKTESDREVATRENAGAGGSISDLEDLVKQITLADKSAESKELASVIQDRLYSGARTIFSSAKDRGVRQAPFVVLIGANMPSILTEVAFISNPKDEKRLKDLNNRDHLAAALFAGIEDYMKKLGSYPIAYRTDQNK